MGELLSFLVLLAGAFGGGWWFGHRRGIERQLRAARGTKAGKCAFCGVHIEGSGWDFEAHQKFYCKPPKPTGGL